MLPKIARPKLPTAVAVKAKMPGAARYIIQSVTFIVAANTDSKKETIGRLISPIVARARANNIEKIGKWIKGANKYFLQKFKNSENCINSHLSAVDENLVLEFLDILKKDIPNTYLRGYDI